jgi:orotidine-5'-phosphate decarboxylase
MAMMTAWVALDVSELKSAEDRMARLAPHKAFKVGLELYHRIGPSGVLNWTQQGYRIFLDAKLHDIPRTVARAVGNIRDLGVELVTLHVAGGRRMLEAASAEAGACRLIGVTVLTSLDPEEWAELGHAKPLAEMVQDYTGIARDSGMAGVVVAAGEVAAAHRLWPAGRLVVPGIRWPGGAIEDQRRVGTPEAVIAHGATDLVLGRSLWDCEDPAERLRALLRENP